ncbi:hypothetical protein CHRYSEOSP005_27820 [Chryseobacterium sp. Alg-005]|uniref:vWA domain-containing protein n=1 Tax=Chryseobacterium sp. Alg-005 TaxID=3159516 RepID=UPI0035558BF5
MENNHDIDKKFNEAFNALEEQGIFPGFDKVWEKVEEKLEKKNTKKKLIPLWLPYGIAASLMIGMGAFYFMNNKDVRVSSKLITTKNVDQTNQNTAKVEKIDSTIKSNIEKEINLSNKTGTLAYEDGERSEKIQNDAVFNQRKSDYSTDQYFYPAIPKSPKYEGTDGDGVLDRDDKMQTIDEVTVVGLRSVRKTAYVSSAVTQASPPIAMGYGRNYASNSSDLRSKLKSKPNVNLMNVVQGQVAGININTVPGQPGSDSKIIIRGISSLNGNTEPLYVVNGIPMKGNAFRKLNPEQIESVQVLKDASVTALYGSRALNGVVVVKTKKLSRAEKRALKKLEKIQDSISKARNLQQSNNEEYDAFVENPFELTKNQSVSTFSIDVDHAAYSNIRRMINNGEHVNKNAVRIEEMINYFKYSYPQPKNDQPFSINTEYNEAPWNPRHKLLKIGLQGKNVPMDKLPASNFIFLIDVSGSMDAPNKLPLLKSSFKVLLDQLRPKDKVGIVVYAGSAGMVLPSTYADEKSKIMEALDKLQAGGSTAGGEGIELAYKMAQENFVKDGNNRVIIATDGDFNVGKSSVTDLQTLIEEKKKSGVFLTCLGFGMGNFKDNVMETLANKGNGNYAYIDNLQEANKFLGKEFAGSMYTIAKDVKIQIEFNPEYVKSYRLIGYENRKLKNEDFTNDKIDAGELGSGHTVTALYEVIPVNVKSDFLPKETALKYSTQTASGNFGDELATVKFRYKRPDGDKSMEITQVVENSDLSMAAASQDFKFASSVAWFGLVLRDSQLIKNRDNEEIIKLAKKGKNNDEEGYRSEFLRLVETYGNLVK